jgi:hypothetical protein
MLDNTTKTPPAPPVRPDINEYIRHFNKPLTLDEKAAWIGEITQLTLDGILPQPIYRSLCKKIESLPTVTPSKDRPEEKLPGSDYANPGPPKPYVATTTIFPNAMPLHEYEHLKTVRIKEQSSPAPVLLFVLIVAALAVISYGLGYWTLEQTKVGNPQGKPLEPATVAHQPIEIPRQPEPPKPLLENPFEDASIAGLPEKSIELLKVTEFKNGYMPPWKDHDWSWQGNNYRDVIAEMTNKSGMLQITSIKASPKDASWVPQLFYTPIPIVKGKRYHLDLEIRAETAAPAGLLIQFGDFVREEYRDILKQWQNINNEWKVYEFNFTASDTRSNGRLHFSSFVSNQTYMIRRISFREFER